MAKIKQRKNIGAYIKLRTKLAFTNNNKISKSAFIGKIIFYVLIFGLFLFFSFGFIRLLASQSGLITADSLSILWFSFAEILILISAITMQIRRLLKPSDLSIISSLPMSIFSRYVGEIISIFVRIEIISTIVFLPFVYTYIAASRLWTTLGIGVFFSAIPGVLLMPLIPFSLSLIIAIPFILLFKLLQDKNVIKIILFIILFAGIIIAYCFLLSFMSDWYIHAKGNVEVIKGIAAVLSAINKEYNPAYWASTITLNQDDGLIKNLPIVASYAILIGITLVFACIGIVLSYRLYRKNITISLDSSNNKTSKSKITDWSPNKALFALAFKQIITSPIYAYFFVGVALCMPILTYASADIIIKMGQSQVGANTFFGLCLLIILLIVSLIGSFSSNIISREQSQFYISKIIPIEPKKQLLIKASANFLIALAGLILCIIVLGAIAIKRPDSKVGLSWSGLILIFSISLLFLVGLTFNGLNLNLGSPRVNLKGEANEINVGIQIIIGAIITALLSMFAIISSAVWPGQTLWSGLIMCGLMTVYAAINIWIYFATANKRFKAIEVK